jgi:hypothetical protein
VKASQARHHFQTGIRNEKVDTVGAITATRLREVPRSRGDDNHTSVSAGQDDPLEVRHRCTQRDLVDDDNFPTNWFSHFFDALLLTKKSKSKFMLASMKLMNNLKILSVSLFRDRTTAILTQKMHTGNRL